jgi:hypothetical protein
LVAVDAVTIEAWCCNIERRALRDTIEKQRGAK